MVELAVIAPLLAFIFIGLVEVGWAIRGYMILLQGTREAARFAVRGDLRDLWWTGQDDQAKALVYQHFLNTTPLLFEAGGGTFVLHRYDVFTGRPCLFQPCLDCQNLSDLDMSDDLIVHGGLVVSYTVSMTGSKISRFDDYEIADSLATENNRLNCYKEKRSSAYFPMDNNAILIEAFYDQPQITGFFWFANPIPLWAYTIMRLPS